MECFSKVAVTLSFEEDEKNLSRIESLMIVQGKLGVGDHSLQQYFDYKLDSGFLSK